MEKLQNHSSSLSQHKEEKNQAAREHRKGHEHQQHSAAEDARQPAVVNINLQFDPVTPIAGKPTKLALAVTEQKSGEPFVDFETLHDKLMHLVIVSTSDLSSFAHVHPILSQDKSGKFTLDHIFQEADEYKAWVDVKPKGGSQLLAAFRITVAGEQVHKPKAATRDKKEFSKIVEGGRYRVELIVPDDVAAGDNVNLTFRVAHSDGSPIRDLEPLMAAGGHCVIITSDAKEYLHVHPSEEVAPNWRGGPDVMFSTTFPKSGVYRVWGQFQHNGRVITSDYDLVAK
jgi:hypothetical protein